MTRLKHLTKKNGILIINERLICLLIYFFGNFRRTIQFKTATKINGVLVDGGNKSVNDAFVTIVKLIKFDNN